MFEQFKIVSWTSAKEDCPITHSVNGSNEAIFIFAACGAFCVGVIEDDLAQDDQLALSDWLTDIAGRICNGR